MPRVHLLLYGTHWPIRMHTATILFSDRIINSLTADRAYTKYIGVLDTSQV